MVEMKVHSLVELMVVQLVDLLVEKLEHEKVVTLDMKVAAMMVQLMVEMKVD